MAKKKVENKRGPAIPVPFDVLCSLLGKPVDDPAVTAVIAKVKAKVESEFVIGKEGGFDFALEAPAGAKRGAKKLLNTLFLFDDGRDGHRGFQGLPRGLVFAHRSAVIAATPPDESLNDDGEPVAATAPGVDRDRWKVGAYTITAMWRANGELGHYWVEAPEAATGGRELSTHPLHFETRPADAPKDAELVGMSLLVAWALEKHGVPAKHGGSPLAKQLVSREITPRAFLVQACNKTLTTLDVAPALGDFLYGYTHRLHRRQAARAAADAEITKLLGLPRADERYYVDDFLATFSVLESSFHVPDRWEAVDRITPVLDARWADFQATGFKTPPELKLYEKAVKARDAASVTPDRAVLAVPSIDAGLAEELVALIGKSLKDKQVKAVLERAGLPIGKRIDEQANPAIGVAYMGTKFPIGGTNQLGVDAVTFYAAGQESYVRGIGATVKFAGYPGPLPKDVRLGDTRAVVAEKLGPPKSSREDYDYWTTGSRRTSCQYAGDRLVMLRTFRA